MPGLVPGIHVFVSRRAKDRHGRDKPGHDESQSFRSESAAREPGMTSRLE